MVVIEYVVLAMVGFSMIAYLYFFLTKSRAVRFRLREWSGNRSIVTDYLMTERVDRADNTVYLISVLWQKRLKVIDPPRECIDLDSKGKKYLEAYKLSEDEFLFVKDNGFDSQTVLIRDGVKFQDGFAKFGTTERQVLANQYKKAIEQKALSWKRAEIIVPGIAFTALIVIIISLFVFWGDLAQPVLESHRLAASIQTQNVQIARELGIRTAVPDSTVATAESSSGVSVVETLEGLVS